MRVTSKFIESCYDDEKKIIIYGAGNYGELALGGLMKLGIKVDLFVDKNHSGEMYHGIPVYGPECIKKYKNDIYLIASLNYFNDIVNTLINNGVENYYDIEYLIEICPDEFLNEYTLDEKRNIQKYRNVINNYNEDKLVIGHVEVVVTERCTLKCKDCANLMQYYLYPENLNIYEIINSFDNFMDSIDVLLEMRILGGEPFIVKELGNFINHYINNDKIKRISIYTNSTILPAEETIAILKNDKIAVHMSDYGAYSRNLIKLQAKLEMEKINYYIHKYSDWNDLGTLKERDYTLQTIRRIYSECMMSKCYTFYRGKLYLCPRSAHGERIGAFINKTTEKIDFSNGKKSKKEILNLIDNTSGLTACKYCNGSCVRSRKIPAAIQDI